MTSINEQPHVLVVPYPAQGHVMPLMKFSCCLVDRGFKVTFVNTEFIHSMLINPSLEQGKELNNISLVTISDGLTPEERSDPNKLHTAVRNTLPIELEKLIRNINQSGPNEKIGCVIADETVGWALDVARKMGIRQASFYPASAGIKALTLHIPKLIELGAIDENGTPKNHDTIIWSPTMAGIRADRLSWYCLGGFISSESVFRMIIANNQSSKLADWVFCNTSNEIEPAAISLIPNILPVGPVLALASTQLGSFWPEDLTCLSWLDQQVASSVIYIAFGSIAILNQRQFNELALGLELLGKPFLWVVRSGLDLYGRSTTEYPDGFQDRVAHLGKIVSWAPQQRVLSHPAIACFVSHCGWNSTTEGVGMGVPFICWPYFADQFFNETLITDEWRVGLGLNPDEDGIISRDEIKTKVEQLLRDEEIKENSLKLKEVVRKSTGKGGSSFKNLDLFMEELKQ